MASSSTLAPKDESGIVSALNGVVTKTDVIANAIRTGRHINVTLVRGGSAAGCGAAVTSKSAGGEPANAACGAPTLQQMISQVGGSCRKFVNRGLTTKFFHGCISQEG